MIFLQLSLLFTVAVCAAAQTYWDSDERFGSPHPFPGENYHPGMSELPWEEYPSFPDYPHDFPPYYETSDMFHDGHNSHWRDACFCLGFNPDIHREAAECMYAILYSAEQYLSNDHGELISHLYNARTLLDDFLHEDSDHFSSSEWSTSDWWEISSEWSSSEWSSSEWSSSEWSSSEWSSSEWSSSEWSSSEWSSSEWSSSEWSSSEWDTSDFNEDTYIWTNLGDITCGDGWVEGILVVESSNGDRGTVCNNILSASSETASIMCRNLGFEYGEVIDRDGSNTGLDIVLDNVDCNGDEDEIGQCRRSDWGDHDCSHSQVVGLRCYQREGIEEEWVHDILTGGTPCLSRDIYWPSLADITCGGGYVEGLVVVENHHNERGTICSDNFDNDAATAVCRPLGYEYGERIDRDGSFTEWDIVLDEVRCPADGWGLDQCDANPWGDHDCTHEKDVGVRCYSYEGNNDDWVWDMYNENHPCLTRDTFWPSLADITCGDGFVEGLVVLENYHNERGTICGNAYDDEGASAACRSMGYESGEYISRDGEMTGYDIALGGLFCPAAAWGIEECTSNGWGNYECTHADDMGVRCFEHEDYVQEWVYDIYTQSHPCLSRETYWPSLGDITCGENYVEGLLLVNNHFQEQGIVCDDNFNDDTATVFCRSMGYEWGEMLERDGEFTGYDTVLVDVSCPAAAWSLEECTSSDWADYNCAHSNDVGLRCYSYPGSDSHIWAYDEYYNVHPCEERNYPLSSGPFPEPVDFPE